MSAATHTPGPWSVAPNGHCVFTDAQEAGRGVAMCAMAARTPDEVRANTRLIAAAPELLTALVRMLDMVHVMGLAGPPELEPKVERTLKEARAAIAKAEGRAA